MKRRLTANQKLEVRVLGRLKSWGAGDVQAAKVLYEAGGPQALGKGLAAIGWRADEIEGTLHLLSAAGDFDTAAAAIAQVAGSPEIDGVRGALAEEAGFESKLTRAVQDEGWKAGAQAMGVNMAQLRIQEAALRDAEGKARPFGRSLTRAEVLDAASALHGVPRQQLEELADALADGTMQHDLALRLHQRDRAAEGKTFLGEPKPKGKAAHPGGSDRERRASIRNSLRRAFTLEERQPRWRQERDRREASRMREQWRAEDRAGARDPRRSESSERRDDVSRAVDREYERNTPSEAGPDTGDLSLREGIETAYQRSEWE